MEWILYVVFTGVLDLTVLRCCLPQSAWVGIAVDIDFMQDSGER